MEIIDWAMLTLRIWVGVVFLAHGINHGRTLEGTARWFESKGFKNARMNARMSAATEVAIGLGMISGLLTSLAAAGITATMLVAFGSIHRFAGFFNFRRPDEGYEYVTTLTVVALVLTLLGPGAASLDAVFDLADTFDGGVGAVIFASGLVAGLAQLLVFWRKPVGTDA